MARTFAADAVIVLPRLDANQATVLAAQLEAAALDEDGNPRKLPEAVKAALDDVEEDRAALQEVLGGPAATESEVRAVDRLEDSAIGALFDLVAAWTRLAGQIPQGDLAQQIGSRLDVEAGLGFVNLRPQEEWGVVETRIQIIEREHLDKDLHKLGATPMLDHLREVHVRYGEVTGATKALLPAESPQVRAAYDALIATLRHYVGAVSGSIQRKKPETKTLADALLKPVVDWKSPAPKKKAPKDEPTPPAAPPTA